MHDDSDWDEVEDADESDDSATVPCPSCGADVYDDSIRCPVCGDYITADTRVWSGKPVWYVALALAGIIAAIAALSPW